MQFHLQQAVYPSQASYLALHYGWSCAPAEAGQCLCGAPFSHPSPLEALTSHQLQGQGQGGGSLPLRLSALGAGALFASP